MKTPVKCPQGYTVIQDGNKTIILREDCKQQLTRQGTISPENLLANQVASITHRGRGATPSIAIDGSPQERMIIRKYLRGGLLRFLNRDIYLGGTRPLKELFLSVDASLHGIPTADILAAVTVKVFGPFYRGYLISRELSACRDLPHFLQAIANGPRGEMLREKREVLARVAKTICSMHDQGFYHGDLNLKNVLIDTENRSQVYIIDWDKSRIKKSLSTRERSKNVLRFCRSMEKLSRLGIPVTARDQLFFLKSYWGDDAIMKKRLRKDFMRMKLSLSLRGFRWAVEELLKKKSEVGSRNLE